MECDSAYTAQRIEFLFYFGLLVPLTMQYYVDWANMVYKLKITHTDSSKAIMCFLLT